MRWYQAAALTLLAGITALAAAITLGPLAMVTTNGISMQPRISAGDLVLVAPASSYGVGDSAAYRSPLLDSVVLHRIVAVEDNRYVFQGDNNSWLDPEQPTVDDLVGKELLHIPAGGTWLNRLTSPTAMGLFAFALLAGSGATVQTRRRRRRNVSRHAARNNRSSARLATQYPKFRAAAGAIAATGALGLALGALTWTGPVQTQAPSVHNVSRSMTFSYAAAVPLTPAYDGTTVSSPHPVFRRLANTLDVRFSYRGSPGSVTVNAALTTASGWHSTVPLTARKTFTSSRYDGSVRLDLTALERRAQAAAAVTGLPADQLTIAVTPQVTSSNDTTFAPALRLALTPLQLKLTDDPKALTVDDSTAVQQSKQVPRTLGLLDRQFTVATGRTVSAVLLLVAMLAALVLVPVARRSAPTGESATIRRRYGPLLVPVHPMPSPTGRPVVDVTEFATLVKLAERYGLLVLHWARSDVETFIVQDDGTTYRYRTGADTRSNPMTLTDTRV